jgi:hypothetical protein
MQMNQKIQSSAPIIRSTTFPSAGSFAVSEANFHLCGFPLLFALSETRNNVNKGFVGVSMRTAHGKRDFIVPPIGMMES